MARKKQTRKRIIKDKELDSVFLLKLVLYLILGTFWVRINTSGFHLPIPVGLIIGMIFALKDRFSIDRKIELALLLVTMFISFWLPLGLTINL